MNRRKITDNSSPGAIKLVVNRFLSFYIFVSSGERRQLQGGRESRSAHGHGPTAASQAAPSLPPSPPHTPVHKLNSGRPRASGPLRLCPTCPWSP